MADRVLTDEDYILIRRGRQYLGSQKPLLIAEFWDDSAAEMIPIASAISVFDIQETYFRWMLRSMATHHSMTIYDADLGMVKVKGQEIRLMTPMEREKFEVKPQEG